MVRYGPRGNLGPKIVPKLTKSMSPPLAAFESAASEFATRTVAYHDASQKAPGENRGENPFELYKKNITYKTSSAARMPS